jgi:hypothetical protein
MGVPPVQRPGPPPHLGGPPQTPGQPPQGWVPEPRQGPGSGAASPQYKGFFGSLLDLNFDHLITTKMIKLVYSLALTGITLLALLMAWYGLAFLKWNPTLGVLTLMATPFVWLFQIVATRMTLEFLINQFKISEYLRVIKDKL